MAEPVQKLLQTIAGTGGTEQEIINIAAGFSGNTYPVQAALNVAAGRAPYSLTTEEAYYANISAHTSLGPATDYTIQDLIVAAKDAGLSIDQIAKGSNATFDPLTDVSWTMGIWADDPDWTSPGDGNALVNGTGIRDFMGSNHMSVVNNTPLFRASVAALNNHGAIEFDGVNENIQNGTYNPPDQPYSIALVFVSDSSGASRRIVDAKTVGSINGIELDTTDAVRIVNATGSQTSSLTATDTEPHLVTTYVSGANSFLTLDGTASDVLSSVGTTGNGSGWTIGTAYNSGADFPGKVAFFATYSGDLTQDARWNDFKEWVQDYYGIDIAGV